MIPLSNIDRMLHCLRGSLKGAAMPVPSKSELARASFLAAELIDLCYAAGKALAADFVQGWIDLLHGMNWLQAIGRPLAAS
jgi:hypothetical protein